MSVARRSADGDLHGNAPDDCPIALLIIDAINDFDYEEAEGVLAEARPMATRIRRLTIRARRAGVPIVYVNDNFGRWRSDFRRLVAHCARAGGRGSAVARALRPDAQDYFVLKPKHSGFYLTSLGLLLDHLGSRTLILTGLLADMCVLFTAHDAYMRGYRILVPADCVAARKPADRARAWADETRPGGGHAAIAPDRPGGAREDAPGTLTSYERMRVAEYPREHSQRRTGSTPCSRRTVGRIARCRHRP